MFPLVGLERDASKARVYAVVVIEPTRYQYQRWFAIARASSEKKGRRGDNRYIPTSVLVDWLELTTDRRKCLAWYTMAMDRGDDVWPCFVDCGVDDIPGWIDGMHVATFLDLAVFAHEDEIFRSHVAERLPVRVDPKMIGHDRVADCDMTPSAFIVVSLVAEPSQGGSVVEFAESALGFEGFEFGNANSIHGFGIRATDLLVRAVCEGCGRRRSLLGEILRNDGCWSCS